MKKHKHAELIKAWADGAKIQMKVRDQFVDANSDCLVWFDDYEYRIKPEPKPDVVYFFEIGDFSVVRPRTPTDNLKVVRDGETGKLKSAEVLV